MPLNGREGVMTKKHFVIVFTAEAQYSCHPVGREVAMAQRVHARIIQKIKELQLEGISDSVEVQCPLQQ